MVRAAAVQNEEGSAPVEFTMVACLVVIVILAVMQLGLALHVRNTMIDAASTGARFGALADRTPEDGSRRTRELISSSVASHFAGEVSHQQVSTPQGQMLQVRVAVEIPVISWAAGFDEWEVTGHARISEPQRG
ncbi:TadE family protein [Nesterenkonia populi]|uniref:TadE family protein n=1 Tax=Nesterenkonia populi TaxID=1591087 RepID=UPI0011BF5B66|nr:TadE/TadG family type IV pilus assembly protein [Nesterenkonia populi]